jgi:hypothetical protein
MDTFIEMLPQMEKMSSSDRQKTMDLAREDCICRECPTHDACMKEKEELLYCLTLKSACAVAKKACLCPTCPLTPRMGLSHGYYCARGSEKEIRKIV